MTERSVTYRFRAQMGQFTDQIRAGGRAVGDLSRDLTALDASGERARAGLTSVASTAGRVGAAAAGALTLAVRESANFENSFARIEGLVGVSRDQLNEWRGDVRDLGPEFGKTANEAADALFFITSAGLEGAAAMDTLEASLKASAVGLGDTAVIADLTTSAMNAWGEETLSAAEATDVLTAAVRLGKLEPSQLAGAMGRVLPIASALGVEFHEVGAAMAAMSRTGTNASEAATQIRGILSSLLSPTEQAREGFRAVGLEADEMQRMLAGDGLHATLVTIINAFEGNASAAEAVFGNIRALSGVMDLMGSNAAATEAIFRDMTDTSGELDDAWGVMSETAGVQFAQAMAELRGAFLELGDAALPVVQALASGVGDLAGAFSSLPSPVQKTVAGLLGITAVMGGGLWFTARTINGIANMRIALHDLGIQAPRTSRNLGALATKAFLVAAAVSAINTAVKRSHQLDTANLGRNLEAIGAGLGIADEELDKLANYAGEVERYSGRIMSAGAAVSDGLSTITFGVWSGTYLSDARESIAATDQALASMVESGNIEQARASVDALAGAMQGLDVPVTPTRWWLEEWFPAYATATELAAQRTDEAADAVDEFGNSLDDMGDVAQLSVEALEAGAASFRDLSESIVEGTFSIGAYVDALEAQNRALDKWESDLESLRDRDIPADILNQLAEMGTDGAQIVAGLADTTDRKIKRFVNAMREGQRSAENLNGTDVEVGIGADNADLLDAIRESWDELSELERQLWAPHLGLNDSEFDATSSDALDLLKTLDRATATPTVGIRDQASRQIGIIEAGLQTLTRPRTVNVTTRHVGAGGDIQLHADGGTVGYASGGTVAGQRHPYGDQVLVGLAPTEEVISNRTGQADTFRPELKDMNAGLPREEVWRRMAARGLADGGTVGHPARSAVLVSASGPASSTEGIDYQRLADAIGVDRLAASIANHRPLYGDVRVYGDGSFRRELQAEKQRRGLGGV